MTRLKKLTGLIAAAFIFTVGLQGQSKNEAVEAYNEGVGLMKTDVQGAITSFEKSIQISEQVGDSAADLRDKAIAVLPDLYYQQAYKSYTEKNIPLAISTSKSTISVAEKYQNEKAKERGTNLLTQLYMSQGSASFQSKQYEKAASAFDSALIVNPEYYKALLFKAQVYLKIDNKDLFTENIDKFIEKATNDTAQLPIAKKMAIDYYKSAGSKANLAKKYDEALELLNKATTYGEDKDIYYQLANIYNKQKNFNEAAEKAQKGLDLETGAASNKAKFYYELAVAQAGKGDIDNACSNFKNAQYGTFLTPAKAQMTNLKCAGATAAPAAK